MGGGSKMSEVGPCSKRCSSKLEQKPVQNVSVPKLLLFRFSTGTFCNMIPKQDPFSDPTTGKWAQLPVPRGGEVEALLAEDDKLSSG